MMTVVPRLLVTTAADLSSVSREVDHLFLLGAEVDVDDIDGIDGVEVHDGTATLDDYATYRDAADDIRFTLKSGATVLVCRRPDLAVLSGLLGNMQAQPFHAALDTLDSTLDTDEHPAGRLRDFAMEYVHD
jgi:hypothetical protein